MPPEQKALRRGTRGCLDALATDAAVARKAQVQAADLSVAWIDCRKAFDIAPHKWLRRVLKAIRTPRQVRCTLKKLVKMCKTIVTVQITNGWREIPITLLSVYCGNFARVEEKAGFQ